MTNRFELLRPIDWEVATRLEISRSVIGAARALPE